MDKLVNQMETTFRIRPRLTVEPVETVNLVTDI